MMNKNDKRELVLNELSKLYIVTDGMKYGADFVLYNKSISKEHGFALVFIKDHISTLDYKEKVIICRICESVKKQGVIAYVNDKDKTIKYEELFRKKK
ncbi:tRNA intron endonuclease, putative [Hepatocystis sp. ex Piliocolobus tephrosceles]|nr:tRNA intron endonuclease, putative [Hepatocystis sp. ex Piliocolobus tephrosceles]